MTPTDGAAWLAFGVIALLVLALVALAADGLARNLRTREQGGG